MSAAPPAGPPAASPAASPPPTSGAGLRTLAAGASWAVAERLMFIALGIFVSGFLGRFLGPAGFGIWQYLVGLASLFGSWTALFPEQTIVPRLVRGAGDRQTVYANAVFGRLLCSLAAAASFCTFCWLSLPPYQGLALMIAVWAVRLAVSDATITPGLWLLSQGRVRAVATVGMVGALVRAAAIVGIAALPLVERAWVTTAWAIEVVAIALAYAFVLRAGACERPLWRSPSRSALLALARPSVGFLVAFGLQSMLYRLDKVALQPRLSADVFGQYMAASQIFENFAVFAPIVARVLAPMTIYRDDASWRAFFILLGSIVGVMTCAAAGLSAFAEPVAVLIYGRGFAGSGPLIALMAWLAVLAAIESVLALALYRVGAGLWTLAKWGTGVGLAALFGFVIAGDAATPATGIWMLCLGLSGAILVNIAAIWRIRPLGAQR